MPQYYQTTTNNQQITNNKTWGTDPRGVEAVDRRQAGEDGHGEGMGHDHCRHGRACSQVVHKIASPLVSWEPGVHHPHHPLLELREAGVSESVEQEEEQEEHNKNNKEANEVMWRGGLAHHMRMGT
jgi:hypothetical protein